MGASSQVELNACFVPGRIPFRWAQEWALDALLRANPKAARHFLAAFKSEGRGTYDNLSDYPDGFPEFPPAIGFTSWRNDDPILEALQRESGDALIDALRDGALRAEGLVATGLSLPLDFDDFLSKDFAPEPFDGSDKGPIFRAKGEIKQIDRTWFYDLGDMSRFSAMSLRVDLLAHLKGDTKHKHYEIATEGLSSEDLAAAISAAKSRQGWICQTTHLLSGWHNLVVRIDRNKNAQKIVAATYDISIARSALVETFGEPRYAKNIFANTSRLRQKSENAGGRPRRWDWDGMMLEAFRIVYLEGYPKKSGALIGRLKDWFIDKVDEHPHESLIKPRIAALRQALGIERD